MIDDPRVAKEYLKARRRIDSKGNDDKQREVATDEQLLILQRKSSRRNMICSTCGQFGHMRSSLKCPMRQAKNQPGQFTGQGMPLGGQPVQNPQYQAFAAPVPSPAPAPVPFSMPQETAGSGGSGLKLVLKAGTAPKRKYDAMSP